LKRYLPYKNGAPSDDTIRRFFRAINPERFKQIFRDWVKNLVTSVGLKVITIDEKTSRRSYDNDGDMLHMVSAFATEARIVLGQEKVSSKSNEITAIPKLLDLLDVKNHIITIDAMGCQYAIADKIVSKEADYILALKGNQGTLLNDVEQSFDYKKSRKKCQKYVNYDKGGGRSETRKCTVCYDVEDIKANHKNWSTIKSIIKIDSIREMDSKTTTETRYYISSLDAAPEVVLKAIRSHWSIENSLHWVLDMSFNEDYSRIRKGNAPQAMAIMRHIALNLLIQYKPERQSIKGLRKMCSWDDALLDQIITQKKSS